MSEPIIIDNITLRCTKKPCKGGFRVMLWVVNFSTSHVRLKNRVFTDDVELVEAVGVYIQMLRKTSKKFRSKFGEV